MLVEGLQNQVQALSGPRKAEKERPVQTAAAPPADKHAATTAQPVANRETAQANHETAKKVAAQLSDALSSSGFRFLVQDPTSTSPGNVVIEIMRGDEVVATIPNKEVARLGSSGDSKATVDGLKGSLIDHMG